MADSLAPSLLLSMPQLQDPNFARTVVLLCEHAPDGAFGLVVNRPTDVAAEEAVRLDPPAENESGVRLWIGGPVEPQRGWILVPEAPTGTDARRIVDGVYLSSSPLLLRRVLEGKPTARARVFAGYAGWGPGQLDDELSESSWLIAEIQPDLIFDVEPALMWETALRRLGADPMTLQMSRGVH